MLILLELILIGGVIAEAPGQLITVQSGTVSGDLYVKAFQPVPWASQPSSGVTSRDFDQIFMLPAGINSQNVVWSRLYISVYSGSASADWPLNTIVTFDGNGDGMYETMLGTEVMQGIEYSTDGTVYSFNDHCNRVYSDYLSWYDVTGVITCSNPAVHVRTEQIGTASYDGRLKAVSLIMAYNDGDMDEIWYWINQGHAWVDSSTTPTTTTFDTTTVPVGFTSATLSNLALSSKDGAYSINGNTLSASNPVLPVNFFENHTWDVTGYVAAGSKSTFTMGLGNGDSFKTAFAALAIKSPAPIVAPTAAFDATPLSGDAPLAVIFTDSSTGEITSRVWDFGDGNNSWSTTETSLPHIYADAGTYTVQLTVTGPGGSDTKTEIDYITAGSAVIPPVADFSADDITPDVGQTVTFTDQSANIPTSWSWSIEGTPGTDYQFMDSTSTTSQNPKVQFLKAGTYDVSLTATNDGGSDTKSETDYITVTEAPVPAIEVTVVNADVPLGTMISPEATGSTTVNVVASGGSSWSVTASDERTTAHKGFMTTAGDLNLENPFELGRDGDNYQMLNAAPVTFWSENTMGTFSTTASMKQLVATGDQPGDYGITITFTGSIT